MTGIPARHSRLVLLLLIVQLHLLLVGLVAARRTPFNDLVPLVKLRDLALQLLLLPVDPFLQAPLVFVVGVLGMPLIV